MNHINNFITSFLQFRIRMLRQGIGRTFQPFCYIAVPKEMRLYTFSVLIFTFQGFKSSCFFKSIIYSINRNVSYNITFFWQCWIIKYSNYFFLFKK